MIMKNILIVGSEGYLGSYLTGYLQKHGYDCVGIDTGFFKQGEFTQPVPVHTLDKDARFIKENDIEGYDALIQLAGVSNDPFGHMSEEQIYDPTRDYALEIANMCKSLGVKYIFPSSCSVYGAAGEGYMDEYSPPNPQTPYSLNKLQVEEGLNKIANENFSPIALRFGTIYGMSPRIRFDLVVNMLCGLALTTKKITLNSNGHAWRPHLNIEDACEAFRCSIDWDNKAGKLIVLNVGRNDNNFKIIDIAKIINRHVVGSELEFLNADKNFNEDDLICDKKIQDGVDTRTYKVSFDAIHKNLPDFKAKWSVEDGIMDLLDKLKRAGLTSKIFNKREFYRLQQIEYLYQTKQIDDNLFWRTEGK